MQRPQDARFWLYLDKIEQPEWLQYLTAQQKDSLEETQMETVDKSEDANSEQGSENNEHSRESSEQSSENSEYNLLAPIRVRRNVDRSKYIRNEQ